MTPKAKSHLLEYALMLFLAVVAVYGVSVHTAKADTRPNNITNTWQLKPQAIPTALTDVCALVGSTNTPSCGRDLYACFGDVNMSPAATVLNITIQDNQASPIAYWNTVPLAGSTSAVGSGYKLFDANADTGCRWFPKGMSIQASGTGAFIYMSGKY